LLAFQEKDAEFFFGRETFVDSLVRVAQQQPLVAVIGSSGSGKSSVVLAGLIPKLGKLGNWLIADFRPNREPFYQLAKVLVPLIEPKLSKGDQRREASKLEKELQQENRALQRVVEDLLQEHPNSRLLLIVDQFEELYTLCGNTQEQQRFVDILLAAVQSIPRRLTLVLTLRADFFSYILNYPPFGEALRQYPPQLLSPMNREEMRLAIERPAEKTGVKLEEGLTERILDDVKQEPGNLPLLEFALTQLWVKQSRGQLTHQAYSEIGEVAKALSNHAEAVYGKLSEEEQKQAQRIFLQLVRPGEGTEDTRRVATRAEVGNWELVTFLAGAEARLVVTGRDEQTKETVEVVHEALIREWERLREWMKSDRKKLIQKQEIEDAAKRWGDRGKGKDYLLGGKVLTEARAFHKEEGRNLLLSDLAKELIEYSLRERRTRIFKTVQILTLSFLVTFVGFILVWRRVNEQKALETIAGAGKREALKLLSDGCQKRKSLRWIPDYLAILLFDSCVNLNGADLRSVNLIGINLRSVNLSDTSLSYAYLSKADLSSAYLNDTDLSGAYLNGANLSDAHLNGANLSNAHLDDANLSGANLTGTYLRAANLTGTNLTGANLTGANLRAANLTGANLTGAELGCYKFNSLLFCTNFLGAINLTPEQVKSAKNWQQAIYDEDFRKKLGLK
jgi:uncharacterized protein YjbI with pentapeptide repeats